MTAGAGTRGGGTLGDILRTRRPRIAATYALTLLENIFWILYPWAIGVAIDGLLAGGRWSAAVPLVGMWLAHILTAAARGAYDTRLFTRIYAEIATRTVARQRAGGRSVTAVAARTTMAREVVDFFERGVPVMAATAVGLVGSVAMLFVYDALVGLAAVGLLLPVWAVNKVYGRHTRGLSRGLNDRLEREVAAIADGSRGAAAAHFAAVAGWRVRLSDAEVANRALVELAALAAVVLVLARTTALPGVRPGEIYAILAYVWTMLERLDEVPLLVQQVARLADVRRRLEDRDGPAARRGSDRTGPGD